MEKPYLSNSRLLKDISSFRMDESSTHHLILNYLESLNTGISLAIYLAYKYGEHRWIAEHADPKVCDFIGYKDFRDAFAAVSFLKKANFLKTGIDTKQVALTSFLENEAFCLSSSARFRQFLTGPKGKAMRYISSYSEPEFPLNLSAVEFSRIWKILSIWQDLIAQTLGEFSIDKVISNCHWGPGSTTLSKGLDTDAPFKFSNDNGISKACEQLFFGTREQKGVMPLAYPNWPIVSDLLFVRQDAVHITTVPKNAKTDRIIGIEPGLNSWVQLGIGAEIRRKLRISGYDLNSDSKNQRGALIGSLDPHTTTASSLLEHSGFDIRGWSGLTGHLSTIDKKAASDLISREVVSFALSGVPDWLSAMDSARSHNYCYSYLDMDGKEVKKFDTFSKFSPMGNGFTFELESLLFLALANACCIASDVSITDNSIFGDDLIIPSAVTAEYIFISEKILGFRINKDKSFSSGPFRESCGSFYYDGMCCKPFYLREEIVDVKKVYQAANAIRAIAHRRNYYEGCDSSFSACWHRVIGLLPQRLRLFGPLCSGDAAIHVNEPAPDRRCRIAKYDGFGRYIGWDGWFYTGIPSVSVSKFVDSHGLILARLYQMKSLDDEFASKLVLLRKWALQDGLVSFQSHVSNPSREYARREAFVASKITKTALSYGNDSSLRGLNKLILKKDMFTQVWYNFGDWCEN